MADQALAEEEHIARMGVFGDTLRQARAHKGVTLREAELATRIKRHWLLALEEEHFDQLPALTYQRGIVRNYAGYLNLDQAKLLALFSEARGGHVEDGPAVMATPTMVATPGSFVPNFAVIAFVLVAMSAAFVWGYSAYFGGDRGAGNGVSSIPTATPLGDEERFIPTNTPVPPTPTVKPDATSDTRATEATGASAGDPGKIQITYASATAAGDTITMGGSDTAADDSSDSSADIGVEGADETTGTVSYSFYAITDVDLLIVVDNTVQWNGTLSSGQSTGYLNGSAFVVSFTGADSIIVIDGENNETTVSDTEFTLP